MIIFERFLLDKNGYSLPIIGQSLYIQTLCTNIQSNWPEPDNDFGTLESPPQKFENELILMNFISKAKSDTKLKGVDLRVGENYTSLVCPIKELKTLIIQKNLNAALVATINDLKWVQ